MKKNDSWKNVLAGLLAVVLVIVAAWTPVGNSLGGSAMAQSAKTFKDEVDLKSLSVLSVQHNQTLKTLDTYSRQILTAITGKSSIDGNPAVFSLLDMSFRPEEYRDRNLIKIKNAVLRKDVSEAKFLDAAERDRIIKEGTISLALFDDPRMQQYMQELQSEASFKNDAVQQVLVAASIFRMHCKTAPDFLPVAIIPPATTGVDDRNWHMLVQVLGNMPEGVREAQRQRGFTIPAALANFTGKEEIFGRVYQNVGEVIMGWRDGNATRVNRASAALSADLESLNPAVYPLAIKRQTELTYNKLLKLTMPTALVYFAAFACFMVAAYSSTPTVRLWGLRFLILAFVIHTISIAIRWWLVSKSVGNWFESIPIKNQFESVLFSSWFGALVGVALEFRKSRGIYGAAASFVGWLSLVAIFTAPYVAGRDIGGEIGQSAGVLMSYWLYIHVTMAVASYALIGMSFLLGVWWLVKYYAMNKTLSKIPARQLSADAMSGVPAMAGMGGGASAIGLWQTLAMLVWLPVGQKSGGGGSSSATAGGKAGAEAKVVQSQLLATLDQCNLVVIQLAFWVLGVAIILGAVWADQSWGRPWGWDPKETFALVTWIVYLAVVHIRLATKDKAWWTAVLSVIGFFVMLFNWIGVNYFLVGLHSYA